MSRRCLLITFPSGFWLQAVPWWWPLSGCHLLPPGLLVCVGGGCSQWESGLPLFPASWQNLEMPGVKKYPPVYQDMCDGYLCPGPRNVPELQKLHEWLRSGPVQAHLAHTINRSSQRNYLPLPPPLFLPQKKIQWGWQLDVFWSFPGTKKKKKKASLIEWNNKPIYIPI